MYKVIGQDNCPYCVKAKNLLASKDLPVEYFDIGKPDNAWLKSLFIQAGFTTVPQIYGPEGEAIGGYDDLAAIL